MAAPDRASAPSGTVSFLFTDIEGSTRRWDRDRAAMQAAVRLHDRLMREAIAARGGHVFKTIGDAFCAAFATPEAAAGAALQGQRVLADADFAAVGGLRVRAAITTGTADERDGDYFGPTINRVARLLALAHGGQVLLSGTAADIVRENPPDGSALVDLGTHPLKDISRHERVFQLVAPGLQPDFPPLRVHAAAAVWLVPATLRTPFFTGRDRLLDRLRAQLTTRSRVMLSGLGGVGKTQAAIEYAARRRVDYPGGVFWVNAETASGMTTGFIEIAKSLHLEAASSHDQESAIAAVVTALSARDRWLLVLDNVEDAREASRLVPEGTGHVLITSRRPSFPEFGIARGIDVAELATDEALHFLFARTERAECSDLELQAAASLVEALGKLPLALEQAGAYIAETGASFADYLAAFRRRSVALLARSLDAASNASVSVTWDANFEAVRSSSPAAVDVLGVCAFLAPDAIPVELFEIGAAAFGGAIAEAMDGADELTFIEMLRPLVRHSLVRFDAAIRTFSVHRLVQDVTRERLTVRQQRDNIDRTAAALDAVFPTFEFKDWPQCERLVGQVVSVVRWACLDCSAGGAAVRAANAAVSYLSGRGRFEEAQRLGEAVLMLGERALGPHSTDVALCLNNLGSINEKLWRLSEAMAYHERALAIRERVLGPDSLPVAQTLANLGNVHFVKGRYADAKPLYARALELSERSLGHDHYRVGNILANLAVLNVHLGHDDEAEALHKRALALRERALGPTHPQLIENLLDFASIRAKRGRLDEAAVLYERTCDVSEPFLSKQPYPYYVGCSLRGLGDVRARQGRAEEARTCFERALSIFSEILDDDHVLVAETQGRLDALGSHYATQA